MNKWEKVTNENEMVFQIENFQLFLIAIEQNDWFIWFAWILFSLTPSCLFDRRHILIARNGFRYVHIHPIHVRQLENGNDRIFFFFEIMWWVLARKSNMTQCWPDQLTCILFDTGE